MFVSLLLQMMLFKPQGFAGLCSLTYICRQGKILTNWYVELNLRVVCITLQGAKITVCAIHVL